jgi:hypothetical protein
MEIVIGQMGGKMPGGWEITVKGDSAVYERTKLGKKIIVRIPLAQNELDKITHTIQQTRPDKIMMKHNIAAIADKPTSYIKLTHHNCVVTLAEGASTQIRGKKAKDFIYLFQTVRDIVKGKANEEQVN